MSTEERGPVPSAWGAGFYNKSGELRPRKFIFMDLLATGRRWPGEHALSPDAMNIGLALACRTSREGEVWMHTKTISTVTGLDTERVAEAFQELLTKGWVEMTGDDQPYGIGLRLTWPAWISLPHVGRGEGSGDHWTPLPE